MSVESRKPYRYMRAYADALVERLSGVCDRIEIAGSIRRGRAAVADVEIVAIPKHDMDLLNERIVTPCGPLARKLARWPITLEKNGHRYKRFSFSEKHDPNSLIHVDLFLTTPEQWGLIFMLRTGSADFSRRMVTAKSAGGYKPDKYKVDKGQLWFMGNPIPVREEPELFDLYGMQYFAPRERN